MGRWLLSLSLSLSLFAFAGHDDSIFEPSVSQADYELAWCEESLYNQCYSDGRHENFLARYPTGYVTYPILAAADTGRSIDYDGDRNWVPVVFGYADDGSHQQIAGMRLLHEGLLDTSFNTDGIFTYDPTAQGDLAHAVVMDTSGSGYFIAGRAGTGDVKYFVAKLTSEGGLDTTFYTSGVRLSSFDDTDNILRAAYPVDFNKRTITVGGYSWINARWAYTVAAFLSTGDLDTTFNTKGFNHTNMSASDAGALAIGIQTITTPFKDRPVLGGPVYNADWDFGLARYKSTGEIDTSFNSDGMFSTGVLSGEDKNYALDMDDYAIFSGGYAYNGSNHDFGIIRVSSRGDLDTSFNTTGKVTTSFYSGDDVVFGLRIYNPGNNQNIVKKDLIAVGSAANGANIDIAIARYTSDGQLNTAFHTDGRNTYDIAGGNDIGASIVMMTTNSPTWFSVGGRATVGGAFDFIVLRIETDGTLAESGAPVKSFGTTASGTDRIDIGGGTDIGRFIHEEANNRTWVFGQAGTDLFSMRYKNDSLLDTSFQTDGIYTVDLGGTENIYGGGYSNENTDNFYWVGDNGSDILIAGSSGANGGSGTLSTAFNTDGWLTVDISGNDRGYSAFQAPENTKGAIYLVGHDGATPTNVAVMRMGDENGTLTTSFHTDGVMTFNVTGNNSIGKRFFNAHNQVPAGYVYGQDTADILIARLLTNGILSTTFHTDGVDVIDFGGTDTFGGVDNVVVGGNNDQFYVLCGGNGSDFFVGRITSGGIIDTAFHTDGKNTIDFGAGGEACADIKKTKSLRLIAFGDDGTNFLLARLMFDGILDTSFDTDGKKSYAHVGATTANSIFIQTHGQICMTGTTNGNVDVVNFCIHP